VTNNVCEGTVTENENPAAGKVKITMNGDEIRGEGADLEGAFTFIGKRPPAPPSGAPTTHRFEPTAFYNYFAWKHCAGAAYLRMAWRYAGGTSEALPPESRHGGQRHRDRPQRAWAGI
jgi:hypothetical protein